jgi:hypothetical protein
VLRQLLATLLQAIIPQPSIRTLPQNTAKMLMSLQQTDYCGHVW